MGLEATEVAAGEIVWAAATFPAAEEGTAMRSGAAPVAMTGPVLEAAAAAAPRVREAEEEASAVAAEAVAAAEEADVADEELDYSTAKPRGAGNELVI
jgi:hypothetical protein